MGILMLFILIFVILFLKFEPNLDMVNGKYILWYTVKGKLGGEGTREYIELF